MVTQPQDKSNMTLVKLAYAFTSWLGETGYLVSHCV